MRWDDVFEDLELEAEGLAQRERDGEIAERTRDELSRIQLAQRFAAAGRSDVQIQIAGMSALRGRIVRVTPAWLVLSEPAADWLVAIAAITGVRGLPQRALAVVAPGLDHRLTWGSAWRVLSRDRAHVRVVRTDASTVEGIPSRVGADFVEMWCRQPDEAPSRAAEQVLEVVPYAALSAVRCPPAASA